MHCPPHYITKYALDGFTTPAHLHIQTPLYSPRLVSKISPLVLQIKSPQRPMTSKSSVHLFVGSVHPFIHLESALSGTFN